MIQKRPITPQQALARAARQCSLGEQAPSDVLDKLIKWGLSSADANAVLARLVEENYLSEERFARAFVRDKFRFNGWGRIKIAYQLRQKHIGADLVQTALEEEITADDYTEKLMQLLQGKLRQVANREPQLRRAALYRFAASRGFEPGEFYPAVAELLKGEPADDYEY